MKLELYTKPGCHLCEAARATMDEVTAEFGLAWVDVDISVDVDLMDRFAEEIPVLMVDGVQRDFWHIDPERLRRILAG